MLPDGAECIVNAALRAMREAFAPDSSYPPLGGGSEKVRFFAGEATPLSAFDAHVNDPDCGCEKPFLWVRLARRYRSREFPTPWVGDDPCGYPTVVTVEVGVARCSALTRPDCDLSAYEAEAEISMDDSKRIEMVLCRVKKLLKDSQCSDAVAFEAVVPLGPDGGVMSWLSMFHARVDSD